jgi:ferredoxin/flavodoxin---NADP+ reductase
MVTPAQIVRSEIVAGRVVSKTALTSRLYSLRIDVDLQAFTAGQFVRLELSIDGLKEARPYSLVNAPSDPGAEVFFNIVPGGRLSNALAALAAGDTVGVSRPATGFFTLEHTPAQRDLWMVATGTGLGPFLSILRTARLWEQYKRVVLVHGVPLREELVYREIIAAAQSAHPGRLAYVPCVSREANPEGIQGRLTDALRRGELEDRAGMTLTAADSAVMMCGNQAMINDLQALLVERQMSRHLRRKPGHFVTEQYF